jgi:uncharacterized protein (DUF2235 family)
MIRPARNLVICCDGTGNQFGEENSNVVKLYSFLLKDPSRQVAYYDPGVGTMSDDRLVTPLSKKASRLFGLAFGYGFARNISDAYSFLMDHYQDGDQVYLFGFSRGAYTARALAGMLHICGLLEPGHQNLIPYAYALYLKTGKPEAQAIAEQFKKTYARDCKPRFLGLWDTVTSLGWAYKRSTLPFTTNNPDPAIVRHAVAIDERRTYYRQNRWGNLFAQDVKQVWFAGAHSDVGGSYPEPESGLSKLALEWMGDEAQDAGLLVDPLRYQEVVYGIGGSGVGPDPTAQLHKSLKGPWWILEFIPKNYTLDRRRVFLPGGRTRRIRPGETLHWSVLERLARVPGYRPKNLPDPASHPVEPRRPKLKDAAAA